MDELADASNPTIFRELLNPDNYKDSPYPPLTSLLEEGLGLTFAGVDTTANALVVGIFHSLADPQIFQTLQQELYQAWPNKAQTIYLQDLEKLPYLVCSTASFF